MNKNETIFSETIGQTYVSKTLKTLPKEELYETEEKMVYTLDDKKDEFIVTRNNN